MKIVNVKMSGKDKFYLVEVDYIKGMNAYYSTGYYASGYYAICMPITLKEGASDEVEELTYESIAEIYEEYEEMTLLMKTGDCSEEEEKKAKELLSDEVIKSLVYKIEMNIREEKEMEKMMKENGFGFYGNMNGMNSRYGNVNGNNKGDITKCKYYVKPSNVTFADIAGLEETKEEILEAIDLFKNSEKYKEMGVHKTLNNIMLSGASGSGKTLLVKAISNELDMPLFACSGDQADKYVGTTSRNIETLFKDAKEHAPAIIFIDEFEAMAKTRTGESNNNEREGGVSTLLAQLDGLDTCEDIMVIVATNLPDAIDPAVQRRFPTKIHISNPDFLTRLGILEINAKNMKMDENCNLEKIARNLSGMTGGDIAQIMQRAGILAVRRGKEKVTQEELEDSFDRVVAGLKSKTKKLNENEKIIVSHHEIGHAIGSYFLKNEVIQKISILPRTSNTLGYVLYANENENDKFLSTKEELLNDITVSLAGRASEELMFGKVTGGCSNDLEKATKLAENIVCRLGMCDDTFGLMSINPNDVLMRERILHEVKRILNECYAKAKTLLSEHRELLEELAKILIEKEEMTLKDFEEVLHRVEKW